MIIRHPDFADIIPCECAPNRYELRESFNYEKILWVTKGFKYDGASVPRVFWSISGILPDGLIRNAALVHDCIYIAKGKRQQHPDGFWLHKNFTRKEADLLFKNLCIEGGISKTKANMAYMAVRIGGYFYWKNGK